MARYRNQVAALFTINAGLLFAAGGAQAGSWQNNAPFGAALKGDLYTPTTPASPAAILVVIHMCTGHSTTVHGWFDSYADKNGFYLIAPDAGKQCFDSSITRAGDREAIVTMVKYVIANKNGDKNRVFAAGMSSGGCMTNTLLAIYPDVFAGGSAMPGFPAGGWPAGDTTCTKCGSQPPSTDGKYWGDMARKAFAWSGQYPCSQQWVGGGDEYNFNGWLPAVAAQFQNLGSLGSGMPGTGAPNGWTRMVYKDSAGNVRLETNLGPASQKHDLETVNPPLYGNVVTFLGLDKPSGACGLSTTSTGSSGGDGGASTTTASTGGTTGTTGTSAGSTSSSGGTTTAGNTATGGSTTTSGGVSSSTTTAGGGVSSSTTTAGGGTTTSGGATTGGIIGGNTDSGGSHSTGVGSASTGIQGKDSASASSSDGGNSETSTSSATSSGDSNGSSDSGGCSMTGGSRGGALGSLFAITAALGLFVRRRRRTDRA